MANVTRHYGDLDGLFEPNLVTGDVSLRKDTNAIKAAIKHLVLTRNFERPFQSSIGCQVHRLLFEFADESTKSVLVKAIEQTINNHEPRVDLRSVQIDLLPDNNAINVYIEFTIKNTTEPLSITIALERTR